MNLLVIIGCNGKNSNYNKVLMWKLGTINNQASLAQWDILCRVNKF
jgi:hypothetical protein